MPYHVDPEDLTAAFSSGTVALSGRPVSFETREIGKLLVSSGAVVASDALADPDSKPFTQAVPNGAFPVSIAIAHLSNGDERIAYARASFSDSPPVTWKMATVGAQNPDELGAEEFFGYGVDSGTGCFMDNVANGYLTQRMKIEDKYFEVIIKDMDSTYKHTRSWANFKPLPSHDENVICFSSGFGDGSYPSFFGFDANGKVTALVTDFGVLHQSSSAPAPAPTTDKPVTKKPWWKFW